jgi:co-chaperonin GroES (HSP10)
MSLNPIKGIIKPLRDHVLITDMSFEEQRTTLGLVIPSDDGKSQGIKPRWGRVWAVGPEQKDIKVGEWVLVDHGRWTRGFDIEQEDGTTTTIRRVDINGILLTSDEPDNGISFGLASVQHGSVFDPSDFAAPMYEGQRG